MLKWRWEREGRKTAAIIYCWQQQQRVHSRTAQLSNDSRGHTCIADLDSGVLALTNAQDRPALLQLNRPLGTAVLPPSLSSLCKTQNTNLDLFQIVVPKSRYRTTSTSSAGSTGERRRRTMSGSSTGSVRAANKPSAPPAKPAESKNKNAQVWMSLCGNAKQAQEQNTMSMNKNLKSDGTFVSS